VDGFVLLVGRGVLLVERAGLLVDGEALFARVVSPRRVAGLRGERRVPGELTSGDRSELDAPRAGLSSR
jgi:hypothetical protein